MGGDENLESKLTSGAWGVWLGTAITDTVNPGVGYISAVALMFGSWAYSFGLYEKLEDRYGDRVREKLDLLDDRFMAFVDRLGGFLGKYGKYIEGSFFVLFTAFLIAFPGLPFRNIVLAVTVFAAVDWYFFDLRTLRDFMWWFRWNPWRLTTVAALIAAYLFATGQAEHVLKAYIDFLQRGVPQ